MDQCLSKIQIISNSGQNKITGGPSFQETAVEVMRDSKGPLLWEQKILVIRGITSSDSETKGNEGIYAVTKGKRVSG